MHIRSLLLVSLLVSPSVSFAEDWPQWRAGAENGVVKTEQNLPTSFSAGENVVWSSEIPGRGHSSPTVFGDKILLTTADEQSAVYSVLCYDRNSGDQLWKTDVLKPDSLPKIHPKNTHASQTVATNGELAFSLFFDHENELHLIALDLEGKEAWRVKPGAFETKFDFGFGTSPILVGGNVLVCSDGQNAYLAAFDQTTGKEVWRTKRRSGGSFSTPALMTLNGREQIVCQGNYHTAGYDPNTGEELWVVDGGPSCTCGTPVTDGKLVFASGGYPEKITWATDPASGEVVWTNKTKVYEQSMLFHDGYLYAVAEDGIVYCWDPKTGEDLWRERLGGGAECASPTLANGHVYHANERGQVFVMKFSPEGLEIVEELQLEDEIFATPAIVDSQMFWRAARKSGDVRQEILYRIGE